MNQFAFKDSTIWVNIGETTTQVSKFACSVYQSAHFYGSCQKISPFIQEEIVQF